MNTFRKLWQAVEVLATSLTGLAETVDAFNDQVRQRAGLDTPAEPPLLPDRHGEPEPAASVRPILQSASVDRVFSMLFGEKPTFAPYLLKRSKQGDEDGWLLDVLRLEGSSSL
jgi:hypothetical protein